MSSNVQPLHPTSPTSSGEVLPGDGELYVANAFSLSMLQTPATVSVKEISIFDVRSLLSTRRWTSCVGHESTAAIISQLTGISIPVNRVMVTLKPGDSMVIFQLMMRLPEGKVLSEEELRNISYKWFLVEVRTDG